jgi:hypothetical protein
MKASEFKSLIKEAVREAIREELSEMKAPAPMQTEATAPAPKPLQFSGGNPLMEALNMTSRSMTSEDYRSMGTATANMAEMFDRGAFTPRQAFKPVSEDPRAVAQAVAAAPKVGLDLSQLSFVNKAAAIVKQANKKRDPYGV